MHHVIQLFLSLFFNNWQKKNTWGWSWARIFLFKRSLGRESEKENDFQKKKGEGRRKEEKRKKRYTRGGSWEERNLGKVIRSHRSKETREKESFETPVGHGWICQFFFFLFHTRKKIWSFSNIVVRFPESEKNVYTIACIIFSLALTSYSVEHKSRHGKWHRNIDLTKSFSGHSSNVILNKLASYE